MSDYTISVNAPSSTYQIAYDILAAMTAQSGVVSDYNRGSQIRTLSQALGSPIELQGTLDSAMSFQALVYSAMSIFGIYPIGAQYASGTVTFSTGTGSNPPVAPYNITIPINTIIATNSGTKYKTTESVTINAGQTSVSATAQAVLSGITGNTNANTITTISSPLPYLLFVNNAASFTGGAQAEEPSQTLGRFIAKINSLGLSTPVSIANGVIGTSYNSETVKYSTVYEPFIKSGTASGTYGFYVYIDNGSGAASSNLISAVQTVLGGNLSTSTPGYRPAGVPYDVLAVVPYYANVIVTGTVSNTIQLLNLESQTTSAMEAYFQDLQFGEAVTQVELIAVASNILGNYVTSLYVSLEDSNNNPVSQITPSDVGRVILNNLTVNLT